jgi:hypothetical protein
MFANIGYEKTREKLFGKQTTNLYIWTWKEMRSLLKKVGISHTGAARRAFNWESIPGPAIVWCISEAEERRIPDPKKRIGHYVVFHSIEEIHDPLKKSAVKSSSMRREPRQYLQINI